MKKVIMLVVVLLTFAACHQNYEETRLKETSLVPLETQDSTVWQTVKIYAKDDAEVIYIKDDNCIHKVSVADNDDTGLLIGILVIIIWLLVLVVGYLRD